MTVCCTFQFAAVNDRLETDVVPSVTSLELIGIVTVDEGWLLSTTPKLAVPPASVVTRPALGATVIPGPSLSAFVTDTSGGFTPA